jgi:hypothetical protein
MSAPRNFVKVVVHALILLKDMYDNTKYLGTYKTQDYNIYEDSQHVFISGKYQSLDNCTEE